MLIVHINVHLKPEYVEAFKQATVANAAESLKEPGIAAFDVLQQQDDPTRFVFIEAYRPRSAGCAQRNQALPNLAGHRRSNDRASLERKIQQYLFLRTRNGNQSVLR